MAKKPKRDPNKKIYPLLMEAVDHMKLTPLKKDFARAVIRVAVEHACMRQAGFVFAPDDKKKSAA